MSLFAVNCMSYYTLNKVKSTLFTKGEENLLRDTTKALGFDYGFDIKLNLEYIIHYKHSKNPEKSKKTKFYESLKNIPKKKIKNYYYKIFTLNAKTIYQLSSFKETKNWKQFTYIKKYLFPGLKKYSDLLEQYVVQKNIVIINSKNDKNKKISILKSIDNKLKIDIMKSQRFFTDAGKH